MKNLFKIKNVSKALSLLLSVSMMISLISPVIAAAPEIGEELSAEAEPSAEPKDAEITDAEETANTEEAASADSEESSADVQMSVELSESVPLQAAAATSDTIRPVFDFDAYDWSDPADDLNRLANEYWDKYYNAKGTALFPDWNEPYFPFNGVSSDGVEWNSYIGDVSKIKSKDYIKERIDNGVFPTDEKFFGVWDAAAQEWEIEPMIDYSVVSMYDPNLNNHLVNVEEAVKEGDYEGAKEAYLAYHRDLLSVSPLSTPNITSDMKNRSDMLMRNMYMHSSFPATGWFYMNQEESDISVDVLDAVKSKRSGKGAIVLVAPDKDEYRAEFYSKEGAKKAGHEEYAPYIEAYIGGIKKTFSVIADAYVGGGAENSSTPFGATDPDRLLVSEAEDYEDGHTAVEGYLIGDEMRRTYLLFDFGSQIGEGDSISSATLHLRGKVTDFAETPRNDPSYQKLIAVTGLSTDDFAEDTVTFATDVLVNGVYSEQSRSEAQQSFFWGPLKSSGGDSQRPNSRMHEDPFRFSGWWDQLAQTYYATGNEDYARTAMLLLHDFIKTTYCLIGGMEDTPARWSGVVTRMRIKGGHLLFGGYLSTLDTSQRSKIATNIQYLFNSEYMTPELFTAFMKYIKILGDKAVRDTWSSSEAGNWGSMQIDGHSQIMYKYPELAYTKPDEPGGYLLNWERAISYHSSISTDVFSDGAGGELSQAYTNVALNRFLNIKRGADAVQYPITFTDETMWKITGMASFLFRTCRPGIKEAQYGDGNGVSNSYKDTVKYVADWTQDPELLWAVYDGKKGEQPDFTSYYYPVGKFFTMRNNWSDNAMYLHTNADFADGAHSHWDDGGVIVSAYGNYLLADVGYLGYAAATVPYRWQISSRGHNTVEINDYCQSSLSPNNMDDALVSAKKYNDAKDKGSAALPSGKHTYESVVTGRNHDFSKLNLSSVYKKLGYLQDPIMAPGGNGTPPQEPGMDYKRNILFIKDGFWIVSDYMDPVDKQKENKYSQYWHMPPEANMSIDGQYEPKNGETVQWAHSDIADLDKQIANTQYVPGTGTGAIKSNFDGQANIQVIPADIESVEPKLCYGYYTHGESTPYGRFDKYATGATKFDTILFPTKANEVYSVVPTPVEIEGLADNAADGSASAFTAEIKAEEAVAEEDYTIHYMILHEPDKKAGDELAFSDYSTNGDLAYYEVSGNEFAPTPRKLIFHNGTHLKNTALNYELAYSKDATPVNEVSVKWSGTQLEIEAGEMRGDDGEAKDASFDVAEFLNGFTVFAPYKIERVVVNGESVSGFKQEMNYVYFGDKPILDGSNIPLAGKDDPGKEEPGDSGNGNGGNGSHGTSGGSGNSGNSGNGGNSGSEVVPPTPDSKPSDKFATELNGHWGASEIGALVDRGVVQGDGGSLNLASNVTRAEFVTMMLRALSIEPKAYSGCMSDVSGGEWYADYIQAAVDENILEGDGENAFPEDFLTREQAVKIMLKALETKMEISYSEEPLAFADSETVSDWAKPFVTTAVQMGLMNGMEDNTFMAGSNTLREQAMVMLYRLLDKLQ